MTLKTLSLSLVAAVALVLFSGFMCPAYGSHYFIDTITMFAPEHIELLKKEGIKTTEDLLNRISKKQDRRAFAKKLKLKRALVDLWVRQVDLLRVRGIGPLMVTLFLKANIKGIKELRTADPVAVNKAFTDINRKERISEKIPLPETIADWIDQAKKLPIIVEF